MFRLSRVRQRGVFPRLSVQTNDAKNLDSSDFEAGMPEKTLEYPSRLPDGCTDKLAAEVPDKSKGPLTSHKKTQRVGPLRGQGYLSIRHQ